MEPTSAITRALTEVGPRLKRLRTQRGVTLAALSEATGISKSTLSRLESGQRRPSLELLLPISQAHQVPLDELVGAPEVGDPRIRITAKRVNGNTILPLTRQPGPLQTYKMIVPATPSTPELCTHEGYEWLYVLSGRLRLVLAEHDLILGPGEAAEFDTRLPHWFGSTGEGPVELLSLFGRQGERMHVRAQHRSRSKGESEAAEGGAPLRRTR
ncbi:XRE family transcriptional regulator [Streptomyces sp. NPDC003077]|uniref:helix-turn-helix domain-containing protein n=1 Tax=Streptomyces sp. NPDC003077 TaxID=3154443 RepID=UPI0033AFF9A3